VVVIFVKSFTLLNIVMLTILANIRINEPERLQHLKDSVHSFDSVSDNWLVNITGDLRKEAIDFLRQTLGDRATFFDLSQKQDGWLNNAIAMLKFAKYDLILPWNEDHMNVAPQDMYKKIAQDLADSNANYMLTSWWLFGKDRAFFDNLADELDMHRGKYVDTVYMTKAKWHKLLASGYPYFLLSMCGIYRRELFEKMLYQDIRKLPIFFTKILFKVMGFLNIIGIRFNTKRAFDNINKLFFNKLRKYPAYTPFELEKPPTRTDMLPLTIAISKRELFACIDDDLDTTGYALISRGLYKN